MLSVRNTHSDEENTVIFNILKKILGISFSSLNTAAIYAAEAGIDRNCLLIKHKSKYYFLPKPNISLSNSKLSLFSGDKLIKSFSKKESIEIVNYLCASRYINLFLQKESDR